MHQRKRPPFTLFNQRSKNSQSQAISKARASKVCKEKKDPIEGKLSDQGIIAKPSSDADKPVALNPKDFVATAISDVKNLPNQKPFFYTVQMEDERMVCLTNDSLQIVHLSEEKGCQIVAEIKDTFRRIDLHEEAIIAHHTYTDYIHVLPRDLSSEGFLLTPSGQVKLGSNGVLYSIIEDIETCGLYSWDLHTHRNNLIKSLNPKNPWTINEKTFIWNGEQSGIEIYKFVDFSFKLIFSLGVNQLTFRDFMNPGYLVYQHPNSKFMCVWDINTPKTFNLPIEANKYVFMNSLCLDNLFLIGRLAVQNRLDLFIYHSDSPHALYPLGLNQIVLHSYLQLNNGRMRFCFTDKENNLILRDLTIPYVKHWSDQVYEILINLQQQTQLQDGLISITESYLGLFSHHKEVSDAKREKPILSLSHSP